MTMTAPAVSRPVAIARAALVGAGAALAACRAAPATEQRPPLEPIPHVVTADIQAEIEHYIEKQTRSGGGRFALPFEDRVLQLQLVRVHTEYLANLGPRRHFACVDLAGTDGNVYDVDFFLAGDPGAMDVTETTVHKINGRPLYLWEQDEGRTWKRTPIEGAPPALLGVIEGRDRFEFTYQATLPELADEARVWIPLPETDRFQSVETREIHAPGTQRILTDRRYGNQVLFLELDPSDSGKPIELRFEVERLEKAAYDDGGQSAEAFLSPERRVPVDGELRAIADEVLRNKPQGDLVRARALYDHTIDRMRYMKFGAGYGQGDAVRACDAASGNCTDYHAYFIALARAAGLPARFAIGAAVPSERDSGGVDGYHCWAEFHAEGKWWPVDISEADKYDALSTYYFGHNPANRVELSRGRDLLVEPGPASGPINFLAYPVLEVAGRPVPLTPRFGFRRLAD
jgi:transglutaminase-like putative cysteine protease